MVTATGTEASAFEEEEVQEGGGHPAPAGRQSPSPARRRRRSGDSAVKRPRSLTSVTTQLTTSSLFVTGVTLITSPLQARALGPIGRGDLAAIMIPIALAPTILSLGLGSYLGRESARGRSLGVLAGSVGTVLILLGVVVACVAPLGASLFAGGRKVVYVWVFLGLVTMPLSMFAWMLNDFANGVGRWNALWVRQVMVPLGTLVCFVVLYLIGSLTVTSAAAVTLILGFIAIAPLLPLVREIGMPRFDCQVCREGLAFGSKAWLGGLGSLVNVRLDQLLMTRLVAPRELGLYVVAVTASTFFVNPVMGALTQGLVPRSASEDFSWLGRVLRMTIVGVVAVGVCTAVAVPVMLPLVFSRAFADSVPMVLILLLGTVPLAGVSVLSTALTVGGRPGFSAISELVAVGVTVPGLIVLLPMWGGVGAAVVSVVAYSLNFTILLIGVKRLTSVSWRDLLLVRSRDVVEVWERIAGLILRMRDRCRAAEAGAS